jgi:hypothetical protein
LDAERGTLEGFRQDQLTFVVTRGVAVVAHTGAFDDVFAARDGLRSSSGRNDKAEQRG